MTTKKSAIARDIRSKPTCVLGFFGLGVAALAWYGSAAAVVNTTRGRIVVPLFPVGKS